MTVRVRVISGPPPRLAIEDVADASVRVEF
jgi:hypothetical protein